MEEAYVFVVFGGTGDLAKRKLAPAFSDLLERAVISPDSVLIGIARGEFDNISYKKMLLDAAKTEKEKKNLTKLDIRYHKADTSKESSLSDLASLIPRGSKIVFYLATSSHLFASITKEIKAQGLDKNALILFEKPFGNSLKEAQELEAGIAQVFDQQAIYRIDHYVAKETVQNISTLKFSNIFFEYLLNKDFVESIEISLNEDLGVGERIGYYNETGAIKDMMQNHMLQVLSLLLMDAPERSSFHEEKLKVLKSIAFKDLERNKLGQYASYAVEARKKSIVESKTETFARLHFTSNTERWQGVDFILQTGKKLDKKEGKVTINFKKNDLENRNKITVHIYPTQDLRIFFNTRNPNTGKAEQAVFDFCHECVFGPNTVDEYAVLLEEALKGNHMLFPSSEEVIESWRIVEEIDKSKVPFIFYEDGVNPNFIR